MTINSKVALITGSGKRRVGWHVAKRLGEGGFAVAIHYRESAADAQATVEEFQQFGIEVAAFRADLRDEDAVKSLVSEVVARFGRIDALVNCAAIWRPKPLEEITAADVRKYFDSNTLSTFLCGQQVGLVMVKQPAGGCIVNFGDWATERPYRNYAHYFVSKGAIPTITRALAVELATRNPRVRVNCILPGPVMLPDDLPVAERQQAIAGTLVKREGTADHVAQAVRQLIENDFLTGVCLPVDGGRTIFANDA